MYTLEQLRAFVVVAETLHFGRAAAELHMSQPPLSRQIQRLESEVGVLLLARTNRRVELTRAGEAFLGRARAILDLAADSQVVARRTDAGEVGVLAVGFTAASSLAVLGPLLSLWEAAIPDVHVDLHEHVSRQQLDELTRGRLDLGLVRVLPRSEQFASTHVLTEDLVVALPDAHPLAGGDAGITTGDLSRFPMIEYGEGDSGYFRHRVETLFGPQRPAGRVAVSQILSMVSLVAAGFGFALVPRSATSLRVAGVTFRDLVPPPGLEGAASVSVHAVWRLECTNPALRPALDALAGLASVTDVTA